MRISLTRIALVASIAVLAAAGCATSSPSRQTRVAPGQLFTGGYLDVRAPGSDGWQLVESSASGMVFGKRGAAAEESFIAQVAMFGLPATTTPDEFEAFVKAAAAKDTDPRRFDVQDAAFTSSSDRGYPCVRYESVATDKAPRGASRPLILEVRGMYCRHPSRTDTGFAALYSHRGPGRHAAFRAEADAFIEGVEVPRR